MDLGFRVHMGIGLKVSGSYVSLKQFVYEVSYGLSEPVFCSIAHDFIERLQCIMGSHIHSTGFWVVREFGRFLGLHTRLRSFE